MQPCTVLVIIACTSRCDALSQSTVGALYIGMAKVLPIIDVLGYDGQNVIYISNCCCCLPLSSNLYKLIAGYMRGVANCEVV